MFNLNFPARIPFTFTWESPTGCYASYLVTSVTCYLSHLLPLVTLLPLLLCYLNYVYKQTCISCDVWRDALRFCHAIVKHTGDVTYNITIKNQNEFDSVTLALIIQN